MSLNKQAISVFDRKSIDIIDDSLGNNNDTLQDHQQPAIKNQLAIQQLASISDQFKQNSTRLYDASTLTNNLDSSTDRSQFKI